MSNIEDLYASLLANADNALFEDGNVDDVLSFRNRNNDPDEEETFIDSEDLVKEQEKYKKELEAIGKDPVDDGIYEEDINFVRHRVVHEHKYSEQEMEEIRKSCIKTYVHDYSDTDIYHMSDEERARDDMLAELSLKLATIKRVYRRVDQYIEAMRTVMQAWEMLEKNNYIHSKDEFYKLVGEGKIVSNRIVMPKLKKANEYSMDKIMLYISNPELDPRDLLPNKYDEEDENWYYQAIDEAESLTDEQRKNLINELPEDEKIFMESHMDDTIPLTPEDIEYINDNEELLVVITPSQRQEIRDYEETTRLLSPEEMQFITDHINTDPHASSKDKFVDLPKMMFEEINLKKIKGYDNGFKRAKKVKKKKNAKKQYARESLSDILLRIQNHESRNSFFTRSFLVSNSMFEHEVKRKNPIDDIYFDGSWVNDDDLFLYNLVMKDAELDEYVEGSSYTTRADKLKNDFYNTLEANGFNTIDLRRRLDDVQKTTTEDDIITNSKKNKKMESRILQRIIKLNNNPKFKKLVAKAEEALAKEE